MILLTKDSGGFAMPALLDLTAAFDTAEHLLMLHLNPMWASKVWPYSGPGPVYLREVSQVHGRLEGRCDGADEDFSFSVMLETRECTADWILESFSPIDLFKLTSDTVTLINLSLTISYHRPSSWL